jgi:hypothetical protein
MQARQVLMEAEEIENTRAASSAKAASADIELLAPVRGRGAAPLVDNGRREM